MAKSKSKPSKKAVARPGEAERALVSAACTVKRINPASVKSYKIDGPDIVLLVPEQGRVRVEISALPVSVVLAYEVERISPKPSTAQQAPVDRPPSSA